MIFTIKPYAKRLAMLSGAVILIATCFSIVPSVKADTPNCDDNAVMRCGAFDYAELAQKYQQNQGGNVQSLYSTFGINSVTGLQGLVEGQVTSGNEVLVNSHIVATSATTVGRQSLAGSTPIMNGQFYTRPPSVSFASSPLRAFVKMDNNVFKYAIILSCGNPVKATPVIPPSAPQPQPTPQPHPSFTIEKSVSSDQTNWQPQIDSKPGNTVFYEVVIKNTGDQTLTNLHFHDLLPDGVTYIDNSLRAKPSQGTGTISNFTVANLAASQQLILTYSATVSSSIMGCGHVLINTALVSTEQLPEQKATSTVNVCVNSPAVTSTIKSPTPTAPAASTPQALPNTGPESIGGAIGSLVAAGYLTQLLKRKFVRL